MNIEEKIKKFEESEEQEIVLSLEEIADEVFLFAIEKIKNFFESKYSHIKKFFYYDFRDSEESRCYFGIDALMTRITSDLDSYTSDFEIDDWLSLYEDTRRRIKSLSMFGCGYDLWEIYPVAEPKE